MSDLGDRVAINDKFGSSRGDAAALEANESVLHRTWKKALVLSWANFIAIQVYLVRAHGPKRLI
jgi:hypothetical protein